jgi:hypothetical protein
MLETLAARFVNLLLPIRSEAGREILKYWIKAKIEKQ